MQASPVFPGGPFLHIGFEGVVRVAEIIIPGRDLSMGVVFNSCETGTTCGSVCNGKRAEVFFTLLATVYSTFLLDYYVPYTTKC
jgi:hypothetical protein